MITRSCKGRRFIPSPKLVSINYIKIDINHRVIISTPHAKTILTGQGRFSTRLQ
jgi:hypothetical protein